MTHDNQHFSVSGETEAGLRATLALAGKMFQTHVSGYRAEPDSGRLVLYFSTVLADTHSRKDVQRLPAPVTLEGMTTLIWEWLATVPDSQRAEYSDHDGSNGRGWRVFVENWGRVGDEYDTIAVEARWNWFGK